MLHRLNKLLKFMRLVGNKRIASGYLDHSHLEMQSAINRAGRSHINCRSAYQGFSRFAAISAGESASAHDRLRKATRRLFHGKPFLLFVVMSLLASFD